MNKFCSLNLAILSVLLSFRIFVVDGSASTACQVVDVRFRPASRSVSDRNAKKTLGNCFLDGKRARPKLLASVKKGIKAHKSSHEFDQFLLLVDIKGMCVAGLGKNEIEQGLQKIKSFRDGIVSSIFGKSSDCFLKESLKNFIDRTYNISCDTTLDVTHGVQILYMELKYLKEHRKEDEDITKLISECEHVLDWVKK